MAHTANDSSFLGSRKEELIDAAIYGSIGLSSGLFLGLLMDSFDNDWGDPMWYIAFGSLLTLVGAYSGYQIKDDEKHSIYIDRN